MILNSTFPCSSKRISSTSSLIQTKKNMREPLNLFPCLFATLQHHLLPITHPYVAVSELFTKKKYNHTSCNHISHFNGVTCQAYNIMGVLWVYFLLFHFIFLFIYETYVYCIICALLHLLNQFYLWIAMYTHFNTFLMCIRQQ